MLNKLADGTLHGTPGSSDLQLVLHQLDGMSHAIFAAGYTDASSWAMPMRLDEQSATVMVTSAPGIATNAKLNFLVKGI